MQHGKVLLPHPSLTARIADIAKVKQEVMNSVADLYSMVWNVWISTIHLTHLLSDKSACRLGGGGGRETLIGVGNKANVTRRWIGPWRLVRVDPESGVYYTILYFHTLR